MIPRSPWVVACQTFLGDNGWLIVNRTLPGRDSSEAQNRRTLSGWGRVAVRYFHLEEVGGIGLQTLKPHAVLGCQTATFRYLREIVRILAIPHATA